MYHLIYRSLATRTFDNAQLIRLLEQSREYNQAHGLSGLLLYTPDRHFLQVLEGEKDVVRTLYYEHIVADPRHEDCYVLKEGPWRLRGFPNWKMGFLTDQFIDLSTQPGYVEIKRINQVLTLLAEAHPGLSELLQVFVERYKWAY